MSDGTAEIHGTCEPDFEAVREAFAANFAERGEIGASVAVVPAAGRWCTCGQAGRTRP